MADLPHCPNCKREQKIAGENEHHWAFRCPYCHTTRIVSKPTMKGASRLEVELKRRKEQEDAIRAREAMPSYSFPSTTLIGSKGDIK